MSVIRVFFFKIKNLGIFLTTLAYFAYVNQICKEVRIFDLFLKGLFSQCSHILLQVFFYIYFCYYVFKWKSKGSDFRATYDFNTKDSLENRNNYTLEKKKKKKNYMDVYFFSFFRILFNCFFSSLTKWSSFVDFQTPWNLISLWHIKAKPSWFMSVSDHTANPYLLSFFSAVCLTGVSWLLLGGVRVLPSSKGLASSVYTSE